MDRDTERMLRDRQTWPDPFTAVPRMKVRTTKPILCAAQQISTLPSDKSRKAPAAPLMLTPTVAWRKLCARTGCGVTLRCFYRWIGNGSLYSVRLGGKIFVPRDQLDELIEKCFAGENLKSVPE